MHVRHAAQLALLGVNHSFHHNLTCQVANDQDVRGQSVAKSRADMSGWGIRVP